MDAENYLKSIVSPLLSYPEELNIVQTQDQMGVLLTMSCADKDVGQIIGKAGATAQALRQLMRTYGVRNQARISVLIKDPIHPEVSKLTA